MSKFDKLTPENIEYIKLIYLDEDISHEEKMDILSKKLDAAPRTIRGWCKDKLHLKEDRDFKTAPQIIEAKNREIEKNTDVLLVTSAQNKTGVNLPFLKNLKSYADFLTKEFGKNVQIVVCPTTYRNPTNPIENDKNKGKHWWMDDVNDYLFYNKIHFGDTLISPNTRIRPTAKEPLTSYEVLAKNNHLVLPHSKIHFKTLPRFRNNPLRVMSTTGYCTRKNYSESKAGELGSEHHSYGFVIIEKKKDNTCHIPRNVKVTTEGSFIDLTYSVSNEKVSKIEDCEGFVWGDIHADQIDVEIFEKTKDLYKLFKPKQTVLHDVLDGSTMNPHEVKDMYVQRKKIRDGKHLIEDEIQHSFDIVSQIKDVAEKNNKQAVVNISISNHDVFLDRYINDANWKKDLHNSPAYLKYAFLQQTKDIEKYGSVYGYLVNEYFKGEINYVNYGESLNIKGYESGNHGDFGSNGSRGSFKQFAKLNTKMIHAHSHSPVIYDSVTVVGVTCLLHQYYTRRGMSSWAHAHSTIHSNGKNQLLVFGDDNLISGLI